MKNLIIKIMLFIFSFFTPEMEAQHAKDNKFAVTVNDKFEKIEMTMNEFKIAKLSCKVFGSNYNDHILLSGFRIKFPGQKSIENRGDKLNKKALEGLNGLNIGDQIIIYDAYSQYKKTRTKIELPIIITITEI